MRRLADFAPKSTCSIEFWGAAVGIGVAAGAAIGGGALAAVGTIAGSEIAKSGEEKAAQTQANMFGTIEGNEYPFISGGQTALNSLMQGEGLAPGSSGGVPNGYLTQQFNPTQAQLNAYPGYQFQLQTGGQALENANTPGVGALSGSALKSLMSFNQGTAASNYQNYFNQFQTQQNNIFNRLSGIASLGQNAAGNLGNNGAQLGTGIAQAQAAAAGSVASGVSSGAGNIGQSITLNSLLANGGGFNTGGSTAGVSGWSPGIPDASGVGVGYCDYGLKKNIIPYRFHKTSGLMEYEFNWKSEDDTAPKSFGPIAQEVQKLYPDAVFTGPKGYLMVHYEKLPGWDELQALGRVDG